MDSRWNDADARRAVEGYAKQGVSEALALRTYTTRLLGGDPMLVLHGGGNTSVKTQMADLLGQAHQVLCVKGSGWDMATIEPAGLPAVKLEPLRKLRALPKLADEDMVNFQRVNLLDAAAPNPSVETLLHAFMPHTFIDHTHAAAVLSLVDQPDGEELVADVYDGSMGFVPYVIPGFGLAKLAAQVFDAKLVRYRPDGTIDRGRFQEVVRQVLPDVANTTRSHSDVLQLVVNTMDDSGIRRVKKWWHPDWYLKLKKQIGLH